MSFKRHLPASAFIVVVACVSLNSNADSAELPSPWRHQDIGNVTVTGSATAVGDVFTLKGTLDIWGTSDGCHFAWQPLKGDGEIVARVLSVEPTQNHAKGGVATRESLDAEARHASMVNTPTDGTQFLVREEKSGKTTSQKTGLNKGKAPYWVKLVRAGDKLTGFESLDGKEWVQTGTSMLKLPETVFVGLVASSHVQDKTCAASFDRVNVIVNSK
jgi:hypothetical protein